MGKYTVGSIPNIDEVVDSHLELIRESILRYIQPQAILLAGSFGRGEGSVYLDGEELRFISDYEICMISSNPAARIILDRIISDLGTKIPVEVSLFWNSPSRIYNNRSRNLSFGRSQASIGMYELKAGSIIFYGAFDLSVNPIDPSALPLSEGIRLIINRMMGVIESWVCHFPIDEKRITLAKLILACGDAMLIRSGMYHFSYQERAARLINLYKNRLQDQYGQAFLDHYLECIHAKLHPGTSSDFSCENTLHIAMHITRQVLTDLTGVKHRTDGEILRSCAYSIPLLYQTGLLPFLDQPYENLMLSLRARRAGRRIQYRELPRLHPQPTPFQALYGAIPALFWSLSQGGETRQKFFQLAKYWGSWALPEDQPFNNGLLYSSLIRMWHILG